MKQTRRTTRRGPVAKSLRGSGDAYSNPSHPRVGLHETQTRRTGGEVTGYEWTRRGAVSKKLDGVGRAA